ncbi:MAG: EamA family transporter RarD [Myxococcota bacterium]
MNQHSGSGYLYALGAYCAWGMVPIYWKHLAALPASDLLAYRVLCSFVLASLVLVGLGRFPELIKSLKRPKQSLLLLASGLIIGSNWGIFIYAVNSDRILDTALGYFLAPLLNVALGVALFHERLSRLRMFAVAMATVGVGYLAYGYGELPWISLVLAGSFGVYGVLKKWSGVSSLGGFQVETAVLSLPALGFLVANESEPWVQLAAMSSSNLWLLASSGLVTAFPLVCFASAARRLPLSVVGLFQYISPSLSLGIAVWLYEEPFTSVHAVTFSFIWTALALSSWEEIQSWRHSKTPTP